MDSDTTKIRLRDKAEKDVCAGRWRYALTMSRDGQVISSSYKPEKAVTFTEKQIKKLSERVAEENGIYKKTDVEFF